METQIKRSHKKKVSTNQTVIKTKAPARAKVGTTVVKIEKVPTQVKLGRGRPVGSLSFVEVSLATLNAALNPSAIVRIDRKFSLALNLGGAAPAQSVTVKPEPELTPSVTTFEEEPRNGVVSIEEIK